MSQEIVAGKKTGQPGPLRFGVVATDPLRIMGLREILGTPLVDGAEKTAIDGAEVVLLSVPGVLNDAELRMVLIDASCTDHLFELLETFRRMRPLVRLIVMGDSGDHDYIERVIGAGAKGYLTQTARGAEVRMALEVVSDGSIWAPRKVLSRLLDLSGRFGRPAPGKELKFTSRENEVLQLLMTGLGNREIAQSLAIDEGTVKAHLTRLMRKVGATNRIELSIKALRKEF
jgi:DNA-binding NarL/FixJ family response regulator